MADAPAPPPDPDLAADRPSSARLVELAHASTAELAAPLLVFFRVDDAERAVELGMGPLPSDGHPADALVGFRAPDAWDGVGIVATGALHDPSPAGGPPERGRFTTLLRRHEPGATFVERDGGGVERLDGDPTGWAADVLHRVLGRPTAPPAGSPALLIDTWWLDALIGAVVARPGRRMSWRAMATVHPLCPPGTVPSPAELAERVTVEALARPWGHLRSLTSSATLPAAGVPLPEGRVIPGPRWFDDGTLARWLLRRTLPPEVLVGELLGHLTPQLVERLDAALVELDLAELADAA